MINYATKYKKKYWLVLTQVPPPLWFLPPTYFSVQLAPYRNPLTPPLPQIRGKRCSGRNFTQHALSNTFTTIEPLAKL